MTRLGIAPGVGPFAEQRLDEALGLAVGAGGIGPRAQVPDAELGASVCEATLVAGSVVAQDALDDDPLVCVPGMGAAQKPDCRGPLLIAQDLCVGESRMVVDGNVYLLPADALRLLSLLAMDAMAGPGDAGKLLHVDVQHVSRLWPLVQARLRPRFKQRQAADAVALQQPRHRRARELERRRDLRRRHPLCPSQLEHDMCLFKLQLCRRPLRPRAPVDEPSLALEPEAAEPLVRSTDAHASSCSTLSGRPSLLKDSLHEQGSTGGAGSGTTMDVHPAFSVVGAGLDTRSQPHRRPDGHLSSVNNVLRIHN